ncbi:hypothetical protein RI103_06345 [Paraburkholderia sp. FT54]|uniref:gp53-like domain-containing protein n=1 Tax=Paraburkholderia sp. FT54 TaxID=3074437 RepID=UPI002877B371|nr:hypothetical protein [Paraburkholderia sp. FT54]WNC90967.1 hypothetical protein RI103_06345 [Paraburkholderia sp. FT54]
MYQIDSSGVAPSLPTPNPAATPGYFTGGNPATGTPATVLDADWFNSVMVELLNVVAAAGLTPTKGTNNQILAAINTLIGGSVTSSLGANGWRKLPDGSIEQWGTGTLPASGASTSNVAITFPIPFPNACFTVTGNPQRGANSVSGAQPSWGTTGAPTTTGFTANGDTLSSVTFNQTVPFSWRAIGK